MNFVTYIAKIELFCSKTVDKRKYRCYNEDMLDKKFHFDIISVLSLEWQKNTAYAKRRPYHALSLRLEGEAQFTHGADTYDVGKYDVIYVPADYDYTIHSKRSEKLLVIHFSILEDRGASGIETFTPLNPEAFCDLFKRMYKVFCKKGVGYEYKLDALFSQILENIAVQEFARLNGMKAYFSALLDYIHSNFTNPQLTVESFAERLNVSTVYLRRLFHDNVGTTPLRYLNDLRIRHATSLLESGYYTVAEAAERSGFCDPKYFSTLYKARVGRSPIDVRKGKKDEI